jgi:hypothetical protein
MEQIVGWMVWPWGVALVVGVGVVRVLWWVLADLVLAYVELPFQEFSADEHTHAAPGERRPTNDADAPEAA